ncbi:2-keto-3-deoxygluconate permease [Cryobacterium sp. Y29]|uniref:2-keto-3-deoxygluconate permease n=1 Tax=Cryobacterium sp. Y29 TaxID=2048285 RepID=UPI000CE32F8C|nr:2-keto-3-deoxygluconate permease [Cryobacterium sp. Y29]
MKTNRFIAPFQRAGSLLGKIPGALMIIPLFIGATINTFFPEVLDVGSFSTALFRDGTGALLGLFFFCMGAQIDLRSTAPTIQKGMAILIGKVGIGVLVGLSVAFFVPGGTLFGLLPLAIIAAMTNSNSTLYVALTKQFGNATDRGAVAVISVNDGPFFTMIALGAAGLAAFPLQMLVGILLPLAIGFLLGNLNRTVREFLMPGESLLIPFLGFVVGRGIDFGTLGQAGMQGLLLGLMTLVLSGGAAIGTLHLFHVLSRRPKPARNMISAAAESTTAGNAIATPAAIALVDPAYQAIQALATAQVAAATVTTAILAPLLVMLVSRWQLQRGITPEAETKWIEQSKKSKRAVESSPAELAVQ